MRETRCPTARTHAYKTLLRFPVEGLRANIARLALCVVGARLDGLAEARLSDLRAKSKWEKAVKLFFSALKNADASARVALCKDPEGEIEKLLETVEEATGEQALATMN